MLKYRQGDVGLEPISSTPEGLQFAPVKQAILAEGEKTGHFHVLTTTGINPNWGREGIALEGAGGPSDGTEFPLEMAERDGTMYLRVATPLPLKHAEHATITIAPGTYKVARQVEYHPEAPRQVLD